MRVEVCHADATGATRIEVEVHEGATLRDALERSEIIARLSLDPVRLSFGIFGKRASPDAVLHEGDRVEVLRPLLIDPMEARRRRALAKRRTSGD